MMNHLVSINAEGGPLLCLDATRAAAWKGVDEDADFNSLCSDIDREPRFSAKVITVGGASCVVWEMQGAGTADIFSDAFGAIRIVRAWLAEDSADVVQELANVEPHLRKEVGEITVAGDILAVLWAAESGERIPLSVDGAFKAATGTAINESVFAIKVASGRYRCFDELVEARQSQARRLTLIPVL